MYISPFLSLFHDTDIISTKERHHRKAIYLSFVPTEINVGYERSSRYARVLITEKYQSFQYNIFINLGKIPCNFTLANDWDVGSGGDEVKFVLVVFSCLLVCSTESPSFPFYFSSRNSSIPLECSEMCYNNSSKKDHTINFYLCCLQSSGKHSLK